MNIFKLLSDHKGKVGGTAFALAVYLFARGCDLQFGGLQFHAEPMKLQARTNAPTVTTNIP